MELHGISLGIVLTSPIGPKWTLPPRIWDERRRLFDEGNNNTARANSSVTSWLPRKLPRDPPTRCES